MATNFHTSIYRHPEQVSMSQPAESCHPLEPVILHSSTAKDVDRKAVTTPLKKLCERCRSRRPVLKRPKNGQKVCKECFIEAFETEVHETIEKQGLFKRGERIAIGASGGKDSTVLAHVMTTLNKRYDYGLELILLSIDEGITGYRDDSLESVKRNAADYGLQLDILSYKDLYGWSMDNIVAEIGLRGNCTFCGVFRRQALDRGARALKVDKIATGHNADDMAETVLMNLLRGDIARLGRCVSIVTGTEGDLPRSKPFKYCYEKEIVMYAYHQKLDYFSTECIYSPNAYRGFAREFIKDLELIRPSAILDIIHSAETWVADEAPVTAAVLSKEIPSKSCSSGKAACGCKGEDTVRRDSVCTSSTAATTSVRSAKLSTFTRVQGSCSRCGYMTSTPGGLCQACNLLAGLEAGKPKLGLSDDFAKLSTTASADTGPRVGLGIKRDGSEATGVNSAAALAALARLADSLMT